MIVGMLVLELGELLLEREAGLAHLLEEAVGEDDIEHRIADRHGKRIAAEGRAMRAGGHALRGILGGKAGAHREAAANALGDRHDVGCDARPFMGEELAGAADAALDLVENQQQPVAHRRSRAVLRMRDGGTGRKPPSPWTGSIRMPAVSGPMAASSAVPVVEGHLVEALDLGAEALEIFGLAAGGDRGERAAVKGAFESDEPEALGLALGGVIFARHLDRAFERFGARIGEEHGIGEGRSIRRRASFSWPGI